jgi:hypothetical protein
MVLHEGALMSFGGAYAVLPYFYEPPLQPTTVT